VGDDGEKDPEVLEQIGQWNPQTISEVYLRGILPDRSRAVYPAQEDLEALLGYKSAPLSGGQPFPANAQNPSIETGRLRSDDDEALRRNWNEGSAQTKGHRRLGIKKPRSPGAFGSGVTR